MELKEKKEVRSGRREEATIEEESKGRQEREREGEIVKNGHPVREDSLRLRRTMRPCSGRDSFLVCELPTCYIRGIDQIDVESLEA